MSTLLEDITSRDRVRVWASSCAIIKLRDTVELDALSARLADIRTATANLSLGGMVFPNAEHLNFAIRKLEYHQQRAGCLCRLYSEYLMFSPEQEEAAGNIRIEAITYIKEKWVDTYSCVCTACGARYTVTEGESHYMWWKWSAVP